jgi:hypothetical protein
MQPHHNTYAIITGASSGIGKEFALELARRKYNLILVALPDTGLTEYGELLRNSFGIDVRIIETDLIQKGSHDIIKEYIVGESIPVSLLINNVGIGHNGEIGCYTNQKIEEMLLLNIACTTLITNLLISELKKQPKSYILNMGSFAGLSPLAYKSIYSASKSYVFHFSESIAGELRGTGIHISVAMPGPVITSDIVKDRISKSGFTGREIAITANHVASYTLRQMFAGKRLIIPGRSNRLLNVLLFIIPYGITSRIMHNRFRGQA